MSTSDALHVSVCLYFYNHIIVCTGTTSHAIVLTGYFKVGINIYYSATIGIAHASAETFQSGALVNMLK